MAHTPAFTRTYSNPASRLAYERPWLVVLAVLAVFALYVASGNYSFTKPLLANDGAPAVKQSLTAPESVAPLVAETSDTRFYPATAVLEASIAATSDTLVALEVEVAAAPQQPQIVAAEAASIEQIAAAEAAVVPAPAPVTAPIVVQPVASTSVVERWGAAGIVLVTQGQDWDQRSLANVDAALSALPQAVRAQLGNPALGRLHILVNQHGRSLSGSQPYGGPANYFSTNDGINELVLFPGQRVSTVLHELGHAYNLRATPAGHYAKVLVGPEMDSFLAATGWRMVTPRDTVAAAVDHTRVKFEYEGSFRWTEVSHFDPLEDYANSFAMYYHDPASLKATSAERFDWMSANLPK